MALRLVAMPSWKSSGVAGVGVVQVSSTPAPAQAAADELGVCRVDERPKEAGATAEEPM
uniref:Uncharacterized protein n=1 Tax=Arundo donax TaxID=35708 RepID=A0A0A8Z4R8_ARUDO